MSSTLGSSWGKLHINERLEAPNSKPLHDGDHGVVFCGFGVLNPRVWRILQRGVGGFGVWYEFRAPSQSLESTCPEGPCTQIEILRP